MNEGLKVQSAERLKKRRQKNTWRKIVGMLACVVVFCTTYALILPAITMENQSYCGIEPHKHEESCYEKQLLCGYTEETEADSLQPTENIVSHEHTAECYKQETRLVCTIDETDGHVHTEECKQVNKECICDKEEIEGHIHSDTCKNEAGEIICGQEEAEGHQHSESCYKETESIICGKEESDGHSHGESCYEIVEVQICDIETEVVEATVTEQAAVPHEHTESCYKEVQICEKEEHEHELICYSDKTADLETAADWEADLPKELTGVWADDLISVATSQLGYTESAKNYEVTDEGEIKGYTRYGQWFGDPYGDWCAMFVSFCLNYAGVDEAVIPQDANCQHWIETLSKEEYQLYYPAGHEEYTPFPGDLIFFDNKHDGTANHVGIVVEVSEEDGSIKTIEGNSCDKVQYVTYAVNDSSIKGFGMLPMNPNSEDLEVAVMAESTDLKDLSIVASNVSGIWYDHEGFSQLGLTNGQTFRGIITFTVPGTEFSDGVLDKSYMLTIDSALNWSSIKGTNCTIVKLDDTEQNIEVQVKGNNDGENYSDIKCTIEITGKVNAADEVSEVNILGSKVDIVNSSDTAVFNAEYKDEATGETITAELTIVDGSSYPIDTTKLVIVPLNADDYVFSMAQKYLSDTPLEIVPYTVKLVKIENSTTQDYTNLNIKYRIKMTFSDGLFETSDENEYIYSTYIYNSNLEDVNNQLVTYNEDRTKVTEIVLGGERYPQQNQFVFIRSDVKRVMKAGDYTLNYNSVKDAFIKDDAYAAYYNSNSPIGTAGSFHLVAFDTANLGSHTNGNVLAKNLIAGANFGTNNYVDELSYVQNYLVVHSTSASNANHLLVVGSDNTVQYYDQNKSQFTVNGTKIDKPNNILQDIDTSTTPFIDLVRVENEIRQISFKLDAMNDQGITENKTEQYTELTHTTGEGVAVKSYTVVQLEKLGAYVRLEGFKSDKMGTTVINVDCTGSTEINMPEAIIYIDGVGQSTAEVTEFSNGKVIWNFVNADGVTINTNRMTGMVIAPGATVNIKVNLNGTVVAEHINVQAESHRTDFTGSVIEKEETKGNYITVQKTETGYVGITLQGAEFDLFKWNGSDWDKINDASLKTNSNGVVTLDQLDANIAYKLVETVAPIGYIKKEEPFYFWIRTDKNMKEPNVKPSGFVGDMIEVGGTLLAANDKAEINETTSLSIKKQWKNLSDTVINPDISEIKVNVYRVTNEDISTKILYETLTICSDEGEWKAVLEELPWKIKDVDGNETVYKYTVEEVSVPGYEATYEKTKEGTIIITNKMVQGEEFILPETGGMGTQPYILSGLLLMVAAVVLIYIKRKSEGGQRGQT